MMTTSERDEWIAIAVDRIWRGGGNVMAAHRADGHAVGWAMDHRNLVMIRAAPERIEVKAHRWHTEWPSSFGARGGGYWKETHRAEYADLGEAIREYKAQAESVTKLTNNERA